MLQELGIYARGVSPFNHNAVLKSTMSVITRFAPSPTGYLHIGGARTALFNWLFARHHGGEFLLRIEDTDRRRSTEGAIAAIFEGLDWLGLVSDAEPVYQSARLDRHRAAAERLLAEGKAYRCWCTPDELEAMRAEAKAAGRPVFYDRRWRDRDPAEAPMGVDPVLRFKAPLEGETVIRDLIQGEVRVAASQLDDMILLRADGTPTYMLSVVVDDIDMAITHVIRGDDHLNNAARQQNLFVALGAEVPAFAHIPLIHGSDGAKLSKRHGALGVGAYRDMGYLPEALCNYLARLGWSHGDEEIFDLTSAIEWFDLDAVGRAPARLDLAKLDHINAHWLREADAGRLAELLRQRLEAEGQEVGEPVLARLRAGMPGLVQRSRTLIELAEAAMVYVRARPLELDTKARTLLAKAQPGLLAALGDRLASSGDWSEESLEALLRSHAEETGMGFGKIAQPLRAALTGRTTSPGLFELLVVLGREEALARIADARNTAPC